MKLHKLFTIAMILFAAVGSLVLTVSAQKKKTPPANMENYVVFTGYQTVAQMKTPGAARYSCDRAIYATANFVYPVDLSDGFYVTIAADGKLVIQMKMTVDGNPGARRSIPIDIIPDDDAELGFPDASLAYTRALITELKAGVHNITVAVSVGEGSDEQIAAGNFTFDNRRGCEGRLASVETLINGAPPVEQEDAIEPVVEEDEDTPRPPTRPNVRPQTQQQQQNVESQQQTNVQPEPREDVQPEPAKPAEDPEVEINNNCGESRYIKIETPTKGSWNINFHGQFEYPRLPLGTKIFVIIDGSEQLIDTVVASPSDTSYGRQRIKLCR